jgi:hypothetical protein
VTARQVTQCWQLEKNTTDPTLYRSIEVATGTVTEIRMSKDGATATAKGGPKATGNKGGPAAASADEIAAQLADPNSPVASLTFKNKFTWFEGDLPDADNQSMYTLLFQPTLPFVLDSGSELYGDRRYHSFLTNRFSTLPPANLTGNPALGISDSI